MKWVIAGAADVLLLLALAGVIYWLLRLRMIAIIAAVEDTVNALMDETFVHQQQQTQTLISDISYQVKTPIANIKKLEWVLLSKYFY